ncbi:MAG TPA: cupredoxin domain-containing protein [Mycobacterium sp.]|jgi:plastocyanin|nr:cupredoxin domain-containing protein [Mycobacterium sp.]
MKRFGLFWAAMCLAAALATACGGSSNSTQATGTATATASGSEATSAPASASAATITIASMNYGEPVTVPPGAQIAIKNNDSVEHSVTSDTAGKFTVDVDGNEEGTLTAPSEPGEYAFHCKYHPSMHGTLIVK